MYTHSDRFPFLAGAFYLAHYLPRSQGGNDALSSYLLQFKDNNKSAVKNWSRFAAKSLRYSGINFKVVVRALGSSETTVNINTPLDYLGKKISREINAKYMPTLLSKSRRNKSLKYLSANERENELSGLYSFKNYGATKGDNILLIDDVVTTGTTLKSIHSSITQSCPQVNIYFFSLTKTFDAWQDEDTNSDIYSQLLGLNKGQPSVFTPPSFYYEAPEPDWDLMERIFQDTVDGRINPPGPNLREGTKKGTWRPAEGYIWTKSNPDNKLEVKKKPPPGPNLIPDGNRWKPAKGYDWANPEAKNDFSVQREVPPGPNLVKSKNGWKPAKGYVWARSTPTDKNDYSVKRKETISETTSSGGCFIATACLGSYDHPDVLCLRQLRDDYLLKRNWGQRFVQTYYHYSPPFADYISTRSTIRTIIRILIIKPLVVLVRGLQRTHD